MLHLVIVGRQVGVCARKPEVSRAFVRHGKEPANSTGDGIFCHWRVGIVTEFVEARFAVAQPKFSRVTKVIGNVVGQDLHGAFDPRAGGDGGLSGPAQVGVVEIHETVRRRANFSPLTELFPCFDGAVRPHEDEHRADRFAVTDNDTVDSTNFACFGLDAEAAGGTDECHGALVPWARYFESRGTTGVSQRARSQESTTPYSGKLSAGSRRQSVRKATDGASTGVKESGLSCESLASVEDTDEVVLATPRGRWAHRGHLASNSVEFGECFANASSEVGCVEFTLDRDAAGDQVKSSAKTQRGRELGSAYRRLLFNDVGQFFFDLSSQCQAGSHLIGICCCFRAARP